VGGQEALAKITVEVGVAGEPPLWARGPPEADDVGSIE
jgi:hypothetical protein